MKKILKLLIIIGIALGIYYLVFNFEIQKKVLKKLYPIKYAYYVEKYSEEYGIDKYLVYAIIKAESNFNEQAVSKSDAVGLMQIMEKTAMEIAKRDDLDITREELFNPETNIRLGIKYYSELLEKYNNNFKLAIVAYNAGIGNVDKWIEEGTINSNGDNLENVPFKETENYLRKIVRDYEIYTQLHN